MSSRDGFNIMPEASPRIRWISPHGEKSMINRIVSSSASGSQSVRLSRDSRLDLHDVCDRTIAPPDTPPATDEDVAEGSHILLNILFIFKYRHLFSCSASLGELADWLQRYKQPLR
ncbi:predicted protein [Histoplasma capsulatum H143]|uniref:Uncharacterized protein n=1 Tax=Ajellomyces capsulatus (strain H143) TaxID=544712 RepID=C6HTE1_AJECH|nr:predicted protein [Histoplasma capsulatum H143]